MKTERGLLVESNHRVNTKHEGIKMRYLRVLRHMATLLAIAMVTIAIGAWSSSETTAAEFVPEHEYRMFLGDCCVSGGQITGCGSCYRAHCQDECTGDGDCECSQWSGACFDYNGGYC